MLMRERAARRTAVALSLVVCACTAGRIGCKVYDPALLADGAIDAGPSIDSGPCDPNHPAGRPEPSTEGPDIGEIFFALRAINIHQPGDEWKRVGYDLDNLCTQPPDYVSQCEPPRAGATTEIDGLNGTDNSVGHNLIPLLLVADSELELDADRNQTQGTGTPLIRILHWNGQAQDPQVEVVFAQAVFGATALEDGGQPDAEIPRDGGLTYGDGGNAPQPSWNGSDWWWARDDSFFDGDPARPRIHDDRAYVVDHTLVFSIPDREDIVFAGESRGLAVRLTDAVITGRISNDKSRLDDVTVAGRWAINDILSTAENAGICRGSGSYELLEGLLMGMADVVSNPTAGGPGAVCDAISVGVGFTGYEAHFAAVHFSFGFPNACERMRMDGGLDGGVVDTD